MSQPHARPFLRAATVFAVALLLAVGSAFVTSGHRAGPVDQAFAAAAAVPSLTPAPTKPSTNAWIPAFCATGRFIDITVVEYGWHALRGDLTRCSQYPTEAMFTLVTFNHGNDVEVVYRDRLRWYQPSGRSPFQGLFTSEPSAGEVGVCAMRTTRDRIACVRVSFPTTGPATIESIPTTDPLVDTPVVYVPEDGPPPPGGFCGSCLHLPVI
ncbi:hypothetical protein [Phytohabitans aurantiacus]|uniref:Uncharacterized protein n=1 Tax=Phytohabitans aurantiacus TaxID=3016789 RepID=A0ABQ5RBP0_9ACTN|nr:hypothetical protein [Phytohabitans aurantiacus]GLI03607.1 hypothetical protein Pa4123_88850 [Phytohabitans aurantiacus]